MKIEIEKVVNGYLIEINGKKIVYEDFEEMLKEICTDILRMIEDKSEDFIDEFYGKIELKYIKKK